MGFVKPPNLLDPADEMFGAPLDLAGGIDRVMGDRSMFARILSRFRLDYGRAAGAIRTALADGDRPLAQRLTHTLKGASGLIEARPLHRHAVALEHVLRAHGDHRSAMDRLETELNRVLRELDKLLKGDTCVPPNMHTGAQPAAPQADTLARLRALLDVGDGAAVEAFAESSAYLRTVLGSAVMQELTRSMAAFDFERTLKLLGQPASRPASEPAPHYSHNY
ncbi:MAG: Hpt domain-containing protein [Pseudomonadota bacterium]|nr:Hpt domain-containing protein [Pseudomonadota bacterium]